MAIAIAILAGFASPGASAQEGRTSLITVPALWVSPASETPLAIRVDGAEELPSQAMLLVKGLPPEVTLSEGRLFGPGVWVVPVSLLPRLHVRAPGATSRSEISLSLVALDGKSLAETRLTLLVAPPDDRLGATTAAIPEALRMPPPQERPMTAPERDNALKLFARGNESIRAGNVAVAQKFYQRAAERGLAEAALALASTYDPRELARMNLDVEPNPALARQWYENARQLGSREADSRLRQLR